MLGYPETKFCTKRYIYKGKFSESMQKSAISKKENTGRRFLKQLLASYEQKKKFEAMRLMKLHYQFPPSTDRY